MPLLDLASDSGLCGPSVQREPVQPNEVVPRCGSEEGRPTVGPVGNVQVDQIGAAVVHIAQVHLECLHILLVVDGHRPAAVVRLALGHIGLSEWVICDQIRDEVEDPDWSSGTAVEKVGLVVEPSDSGRQRILISAASWWTTLRVSEQLSVEV